MADVERIRALSSNNQMQGGVTPLGQYTATTIDDHAAICWAITHLVSQIAPNLGTIRGIYNAINNYLTDDDSFVDLDKTVETIRDVAIDGLFEYLDEKLDSRNITYGLLLKYKQRSEWFHRSRLRAIADGEFEGKSGEKALAVDLQEYVFDQQVEFVIEPVSASGETDLVLKDPEGGRLILDDKYIAEDASRSEIVRKLSEGFHQVYRYCVDFNEPDGYLVVFIRSAKRIALELEQSDGARFLRLGGKNIYYIEVHVSEEPSASRSGRAEEIQISRDELIKTVED